MVEALRQQIGRINWFSNVGSELNLSISMEVSYVKTWNAATAEANGIRWENTQLAARGDFTGWLTINHPREYQGI